jgi:hypothetical protein
MHRISKLFKEILWQDLTINISFLFYTISGKKPDRYDTSGEFILNFGIKYDHPLQHACSVTKKYSVEYILRVSRMKQLFR